MLSYRKLSGGVESSSARRAWRPATQRRSYSSFFPVLVTIEDQTSDPVLVFSVLFGLLAILAALSMSQERPLLYVPAAFLAVLAEAQWGGEHLSKANLTTGLVVFSAFTVPLHRGTARRGLE